jgi:hypothetical protein
VAERTATVTVGDDIDWIEFTIELMRRLDRIGDELHRIGDHLAGRAGSAGGDEPER